VAGIRRAHVSLQIVQELGVGGWIGKCGRSRKKLAGFVWVALSVYGGLSVAEIEDDFLFGLRWTGSILPVLDGLYGVLDEDGVSAANINVRYISIRKHGYNQADEPFDMQVLQSHGICRFNFRDHLAGDLSSFLGQTSWNESGGQAKGQHGRCENPLDACGRSGSEVKLEHDGPIFKVRTD
jgi:hypothetical protein